MHGSHVSESEGISQIAELFSKRWVATDSLKWEYSLLYFYKVMRRVLVIEDDKLVRASVSLSLETAGYEVMEAASCQEGLQSHGQFGASVIISDVVSLENDGGELLRRFCQESPDIPIITMIGTLSDSSHSTSKTQLAMPMSPHTLEKPFTLDELLSTVQNALAH